MLNGARPLGLRLMADWTRNIEPNFRREGWEHLPDDAGEWSFEGVPRETVRFEATVSVWTNNLSRTEYWESRVDRVDTNGPSRASATREFDGTPEGLVEAMAWAEGVIAGWDRLWQSAEGRS